jgi:hypothetical protein
MKFQFTVHKLKWVSVNSLMELDSTLSISFLELKDTLKVRFSLFLRQLYFSYYDLKYLFQFINWQNVIGRSKLSQYIEYWTRNTIYYNILCTSGFHIWAFMLSGAVFVSPLGMTLRACDTQPLARLSIGCVAQSDFWIFSCCWYSHMFSDRRGFLQKVSRWSGISSRLISVLMTF